MAPDDDITADLTDLLPVEKADAAPSSPQPHSYGYAPTPPQNSSPYTELGASGLAQYGGFIREEFLPQLQGDRAIQTWREMYDNDPIVGALVFAVQMLIRKVEWRLEPAFGSSVEEILQRREEERAEQEQEKAQAQQAQMAQDLMAAQPQSGQPGQPAPGQPGQPPNGGQPPPHPFASALPKPATGAFHQPLGRPSPPSRPVRPARSPSPIRKWFEKAGGTTGGTVSTTAIGMLPSSTADDPDTQEPIEPPYDPQTFQQTPEQRKAEELAIFVETCIHDLNVSWADFLAEIMTMIVFGFAFFETVYKKRKGPVDNNPVKSSRYDDGRVGWAKLASRAQETRWRWEIDDNGNVLGLWQLAPPYYQMKYIPMQKALLFRTTSQKGNPEGRSSLRSAYTSYYMKNRIQTFEGVGVERNLAGMPIAYVPYQMMTATATAEERATLAEIKQLVRNIRRDEKEGVVFPMVYDPETKQPLYKLELLSSTASRSNLDTDKIIARYDQRIAMTVLADFILLGHEAVGSKALGETKADIFTTALESWLNSIADVFNTQAIPRLMKINGEDPARAPKLVFGKLTHIRPAELAQYVSQLATAGAEFLPDSGLENVLRQVVGLPPKGSSDDL